jgi:hydrophobe/amphiphile efflux-3 (HAE3) family protein
VPQTREYPARVHLSRVLRAVMGGAVRRPLAVSLAVGLLALAGGALALATLRPSAATDTLVGRSTASYAATDELHRKFGDEAVYVLIRQPLTKTVLTSDLLRVLALEGCLSGNVPKNQTPRGGRNGPCAQLARTKPVKVVFGPGTFLNEAVGQIQDQFSAQSAQKAAEADRAGKAARALARAQGKSEQEAKRLGEQAKQLVFAEFVRNTFQLALQYGITSAPQLNDPSFVSRIVFDINRPQGTPKARFAYIFPAKDSALIQVRLRPGLTEDQRSRAIGLIRRAVAMPDWRLPNGKGTYVVTGAPVVVDELTGSISRSIVILLAAALVVMALTLAAVFRTRLRLLPLVVALAAAALTFGGLAVLGAPLTMASIGVLPVLIGLGVDYAIQLQSRVQEEARGGEPVAAAVDRAAVRGAPTVATAAAATGAGFLVLALSPVPMVRGFGLLLVAGIAVALVCALTLGIGVLAGMTARGAGPARSGRLAAAARGAGELAAPAIRGAGELVAGNRAARAVRARGAAAGRGALRAATAHPGRVVAIAVVLAVLGWGLDTQTRVESDLQKLVPQNGAIADLHALEQATGVGGEIDVVVSSDRLTDPKVVRWMTSYQDGLLKRYGYSDRRGCGRAELCPAFSLPDLFRGGGTATKGKIDGLLDAVPPYFSQGVITRDRRTATLAFGIRLMPLERQEQVISAMRGRLHPPAGVRAQLAGLPVLAADANDRVASPWRRELALVAGLAAVALVLLLALRRARRALVPLVPIALATGWSALVLFCLRVPLNPMSVTLGALVIAIATEFSVLLSERFRAERAAGHAPEAALERTYRSTGAAVLASGTTAIAGFAVLVVSDIRMLRDFGFVTVVDLTVALAGVMLVLPAVLLLAERDHPLRLRVPVRGRPGRRRRPRRPRAQRAAAG